MRTILACLVIAVVASSVSPTAADTLGSREKQRGVITEIDKGVFQLSADSTLVLGYSKEDDSSAFRSNMFANAGVRFFPKRNLGLSLRGGLVYRKVEETRVLGWAATIWANYFMRMGEGIFFSPGAGVGFSSAQRDIPLGANVIRSTQNVGIGGVEMMLTVFLNRRFAVTAGPEFILSVGSATPEDSDDSTSVLALDGGFKVGVLYSY